MGKAGSSQQIEDAKIGFDVFLRSSPGGADNNDGELNEIMDFRQSVKLLADGCSSDTYVPDPSEPQTKSDERPKRRVRKPVASRDTLTQQDIALDRTVPQPAPETQVRLLCGSNNTCVK